MNQWKILFEKIKAYVISTAIILLKIAALMAFCVVFGIVIMIRPILGPVEKFIRKRLYGDKGIYG